MRKGETTAAVMEDPGVYQRLRPHERLDVWKMAVDLVCEIYGITKAVPREEMFVMVPQLRRAAVSVPANIAEGSARRSPAERRRFYYIARASLSELETHLEMARRLRFIQDHDSSTLRTTCGRIAAMPNGMIRA